MRECNQTANPRKGVLVKKQNKTKLAGLEGPMCGWNAEGWAWGWGGRGGSGSQRSLASVKESGDGNHRGTW